MRRDHARRQVYLAEDACLAGTAFDDAPGEAVLSEALAVAFTDAWWRRAVGGAARVTFADNRGTGFYRHAERHIHLGRTARWLVAAHELAHMAAAHDRRRDADAPAHDDGFCGWEVVVFTVLFGSDAADVLRTGFATMGIAVTPPPNVSPDVPAPLWQRFVNGVARGGWEPPAGIGPGLQPPVTGAPAITLGAVAAAEAAVDRR